MSLYIEGDYLKCKNCTLDIPLRKIPKGFDPLKIKHGCNKEKRNNYDRFNRPGLIKKAINFTTATKDHIKAGHKSTKPELHKLRLEICNTCDHGDNEECFVCGCKLVKKAAWAEQECPLYKWPKKMKDLFWRDKKPGNLRNLFYGAGCFFIGGGPSLEKLNLDLLKERGILTFGVNNIAAWKNIKPNLWCSTDNPHSFHETIWSDPTIMKFVTNGNYSKIKAPPNCYTFQVNEDFNPYTFFTEPTVNFGNRSDLYDQDKQKGGRSVMYCSLRIMHYLGIKRVYLLGCDFHMDDSRPYLFDQHKWKGGIQTNNDHYAKMNVRFKHLDRESRKHDYRIYNCSPGSSLTAFEFLDYEKAIKEELIETPKSLAKMYGEKPHG
jgi:hypothetical protein